VDGLFTPRYSFQDSQSILKALEGVDIDQVGSRDSALGDEHGGRIFHQLGKNLRSLPL
jgi:hypothetical protein